MIMAKLDAEGQLERLMKAYEEEATDSVFTDEAEEEPQYPFYTEGSKTLLDASIDIAKYSLVRAALRFQRAQRRKDDPDEDIDTEIMGHRNREEFQLKAFGTKRRGRSIWSH
ncbi:hypothetical protein VNO77_31149 [Canavalia gladiata]|uniref:Uncharacterized protein n=1 Tax=Canavalia gladiata TaxID=3824 RepID=A0AAN9KS78_CANGL